MYRGRGTSFFPVKHEKLPPSYIQDAKNFSVVKPLNSGEARASPASPVPRPLFRLFLSKYCFQITIFSFFLFLKIHSFLMFAYFFFLLKRRTLFSFTSTQLSIQISPSYPTRYLDVYLMLPSLNSLGYPMAIFSANLVFVLL